MEKDEKICTTEKEIHEVLENAEKYLQKHGLKLLILMVDSKRCKTISVIEKNLKKMDNNQLFNYSLGVYRLLNLTKDEIARRTENGMIARWVKNGIDC